ncbi:MAG TPA: hypothetical protein VFP00_00455 [Burkholderiales bacterium]|nr:hypothetical protein [Burkholderiales bacterium]
MARRVYSFAFHGYHHHAGTQADSHTELWCVRRRASRACSHRALYGERSTARLDWVILYGDRRPKNRQHSITLHFGNVTGMALDRVGHILNRGREQTVSPFCVRVLNERSGTDNVGEKDRNAATIARNRDLSHPSPRLPVSRAGNRASSEGKRHGCPITVLPYR